MYIFVCGRHKFCVNIYTKFLKLTIMLAKRTENENAIGLVLKNEELYNYYFIAVLWGKIKYNCCVESIATRWHGCHCVRSGFVYV